MLEEHIHLLLYRADSDTDLQVRRIFEAKGEGLINDMGVWEYVEGLLGGIGLYLGVKRCLFKISIKWISVDNIEQFE